MGAKRRAARRVKPGEDPRRDLLVWRGVVLVAVGFGGLAGLGVAWSAQQGDALTAGLFTLALVALLALLLYALARVRATLRHQP